MKEIQNAPSDNWSESPFASFSRNIYSQNGEDGILEEIFKRLDPILPPNNSRTCVEFGAWDGIYLSNVFNFVENHKWKAILIEGIYSRFVDLEKLASRHPSIIPVNKFISRWNTEEHHLGKILRSYSINKNFELLSIDIDSYDLDVWEGLVDFFPTVVVIEINSSFAPGILKRHNDLTSGNSFTSTLEVAQQKGYTLVAHTGNCIFVKDEFIPFLNFSERYIRYPDLLFKWWWVSPEENFLKKSSPKLKRRSFKVIRKLIRIAKSPKS
jgi:hypothetical protein